MLGGLGYYGQFFQHQNPRDTKIFFQTFLNRIRTILPNLLKLEIYVNLGKILAR